MASFRRLPVQGGHAATPRRRACPGLAVAGDLVGVGGPGARAGGGQHGAAIADRAGSAADDHDREGERRLDGLKGTRWASGGQSACGTSRERLRLEARSVVQRDQEDRVRPHDLKGPGVGWANVGGEHVAEPRARERELEGLRGLNRISRRCSGSQPPRQRGQLPLPPVNAAFGPPPRSARSGLSRTSVALIEQVNCAVRRRTGAACACMGVLLQGTRGLTGEGLARPAGPRPEKVSRRSARPLLPPVVMRVDAAVVMARSHRRAAPFACQERPAVRAAGCSSCLNAAVAVTSRTGWSPDSRCPRWRAAKGLSP